MSHTVKIAVQFKTSEVAQLKKALEVKGWALEENATSRQYAGRVEGPYRYVAKNPSNEGNAYDIGINVKGENLELLSDFYGGSIEKSLGANLQGLKQEFAAAVIEDEYPNATITRTLDNEGNLILDLESWS
jgi:hypothetical protein